jgi:hypothetical protein
MSWLVGPGAAVSWRLQELLCPGGWVQELQCPGRSMSGYVLVGGSKRCSVLVDP